LIPCETKISAYTGETPMPPWPLRLTPFPHTSGFLSLAINEQLAEERGIQIIIPYFINGILIEMISIRNK